MESEVLEILRSIRQDCDEIRQRGDLSEYGEGQLRIVEVVLGEGD